MNSKTIFVSCTIKNSKDFEDTVLAQSIKKLQLVEPNVSLEVFFENQDGLSKCYNKAIEKYKDCKDIEQMVFIHDDVRINDLYIIDKLKKSHQNFDILGIAGSSNFSMKRNPIIWINSPQESHSGFIEHSTTDKSCEGGFHINMYGQPNKKCIVIDGVFISVNFQKMIENELRFDETFKFHFYDLSLCLRAYKLGMEIGTTNVCLTHFSHGNFLKDEKSRNDFFMQQQKFIFIYNKKGE